MAHNSYFLLNDTETDKHYLIPSESLYVALRAAMMKGKSWRILLPRKGLLSKESADQAMSEALALLGTESQLRSPMLPESHSWRPDIIMVKRGGQISGLSRRYDNIVEAFQTFRFDNFTFHPKRVMEGVVSMTFDWRDAQFETLKREYPNFRYGDVHETCQGCFYNYNHVLHRVLKIEMSKRVFISNDTNWTLESNNSSLLTSLYFPTQTSTAMSNDICSLVEMAWREVLLLPVAASSHTNRPFPMLQYLAKLTIWESIRKNIGNGGVDLVIKTLKLPVSIQNDLEKFVIYEEISMRKHLCMKFREVLFCTDFLKEKVFH